MTSDRPRSNAQPTGPFGNDDAADGSGADDDFGDAGGDFGGGDSA